MAQIFPTLENIQRLKVKPTNGEWFLINYLADNFSDDVEIYFQPFLNGDMPDIILMQKNCGVTIIEVKDWDLNSYHLTQKGDWVLNKNDAILKSPFKQVFQYKDNMFNLHINGLLEKKILNPKFYGRINVFVYFHDISQSELKQFYQPVIKLSNPNQLMKLTKQSDYYAKTKDTIKSICLPRKDESLFSEGIYKEFTRYLQPPYHVLEQGKERNYTVRQKNLCESSPRHQKIKGVAGAGKTLVLAKRAVNAHKRHNGKILILTFNITLKSYIHDMLSDVRENFSWGNFIILNYHHFFNITANNFGLKIENLLDYDDENYFERIKDEIPKYESIFIDEIQDYKVAWIRLIKKYFLTENGELVIFGDEKQNIYDRALGDDKKPNTTIIGGWNILDESFRLNTKIALLAEEFQKYYFKDKYEIDSIKSSKLKQGSFDFETNILRIETYQNDSNILVGSIFDIIKSHNIHPNDVCILASNIHILIDIDWIIRRTLNEKTLTTFETKEMLDVLAKQHSSDKELLKSEIENVRKIKKVAFKLNNGMLKISTIQSFKGWQISTLFLIIDDNSNEAIYTAITRAKNNLIIFDKENGKYYKFFKDEIDKLNNSPQPSKLRNTEEVLFGTIQKILNDNDRGKDGFVTSNGVSYYFTLPEHIGFTKKIQEGSIVKFVPLKNSDEKKRAKIIKIES